MRPSLLALLLVGCGGACSPGPLHWPDDRRPVRVIVSRAMSPECADAAGRALAFWQEHVDYLEPELVAPTHPALIGVPRVGEIGVSEGVPSGGPAVAGETRYTHDASGGLLSADVVVRMCVGRVFAHELGHALGLRHEHDDPLNLMFYVTGPEADALEWRLTPEQIEAVQ